MPGPSNTLLIEGSFSELAEELAQYIDAIAKSEEGAGVAAAAEQLLASIREAEQSPEPVDDAAVQKQKDEVLKKIVTEAKVLNQAPEKEFAAAYNLLISLSSTSPVRDQLFARLCQYLSESLPSSPTYGSPLAISTLSTIFNVLPLNSDARYHVFLAILNVIKRSNNITAFEALVPQLESNIPVWLAAWSLDEDDIRNLHVTIADVAKSTGNANLEYTYLLLALESIAPDSAAEAESRDLAKRTLVAALTHPSITDFTPLTASDAVQALRRSDGPLFELLEIFSSDDYASYLEHTSANSISSLGLPEDSAGVLEKKIRLLTLATICASSPSRSVPYATIAASLQVPAEDVEMWVIDTIRAGLIEGKLSQLKGEFLVQRATYRVFGEKQWAEIQGRLMVWRRSLESVLSVVRSERERFAKEGMGTVEQNGFDGEVPKPRRQGGRRGNRERTDGPREPDLGD